jgi:hypothetical protein
VFYLNKTTEVWTLIYEVGPLRRWLLVAAGIAGIALTAVKSVQDGLAGSTLAVVVGVLVAIAAMAYWVFSDASSRTVFDLVHRNVTVQCERFGFGPQRSLAFSDVARLCAVDVSGETVDSWDVRLELRDGRRIRLGREPQGHSARSPGYLEEIRAATGIAGR